MSFFQSDDYQGFPGNITLTFPHEQIGLPQIEGYTLESPQYFTEIEVLDGPARRRLDSPLDIFKFTVSFFCNQNKAKSFEGFYYDTIDQGMLWFRIPLSTGTGMRSCTVREAADSPYVMTRIGTHYRYEWALEGYRGAIIDEEFIPPIIDPPDEPIPDFYDAGTASDNFTDFIDAKTASDNLTDFISGGNAQS